MGHDTHIGYVSIERARTERDALIEVAGDWRDEGGAGYSGLAASKSFSLMTRHVFENSIDREQMMVNDRQSVVVPVCSHEDAVVKHIKHDVTVSAETLARLRKPGGKYVLLEQVRKELGMSVVDMEFVALPKARKATAVATDGKAVTKYRIHQSETPLKETFDSQAEARAAAIGLMNSNDALSRLTIRAVVVRVGADAVTDPDLVVIERPEPESAVVKILVTTSVPKPGAKQAGWCVGFDVDS